MTSCASDRLRSFAALFLFSALTLFLIGWIMVFDASSAEIMSRSSGKNLHIAATKQLISGGLAALIGAGVYYLGFDRLWRAVPYLFWGVTLLLAFTLIPGIGQKVNAARRWISIAGFSLQPSEFIKYLIAPACIYFLSREQYLTFSRFIQVMLKLLIPIALVFLEPDNGAVFVSLVGLVATLFILRIDMKFWMLPMLVIVACGAMVASKMPHVPARIRIYLNPELDLLGRGHQPHQAKIAAGAGGLWGRGLGKSIQKLEYLPEAQNDYIAAIFAEEFGFAGICVLIGLYLAMGLSGFAMAVRAPTLIAFQLMGSLLFTFLIQAFLNLGVVCALIPSTGMNLPLFSQGGTSLLVHGALIGMILSLSSPQGLPKRRRL
jgi:cell division protein FtsW